MAITDYIPLGSAPADEDHAELSSPSYAVDAHKECRAYIQAIRRKLGPEPQGARLDVMAFPHESGTYYEVICRFDNAQQPAVAYALRCESRPPETWGEVGMRPPLGRRHAHGR
jgi:hypothetical protein